MVVTTQLRALPGICSGGIRQWKTGGVFPEHMVHVRPSDIVPEQAGGNTNRERVQQDGCRIRPVSQQSDGICRSVLEWRMVRIRRFVLLPGLDVRKAHECDARQTCE